jgi:rhamnosyl/mannosyltransferase
MRILFVSHYQRPHLGGIELIVDGLARTLTARGHDVTVVSSDAGARDRAVPAMPYRSLRIPAFNGLEERLGVPYPLFAPRLLRVLRREVAAADIVHAHGWLYQGTVAAFALARGRAIRVLSEHVGHVPYASPVLDRTETLAEATIGRFTARSADGLVLLNKQVHAEVVARAPQVPVFTIGVGTDTARFRPAEPGERERLRERLGWDAAPRVLFAGRLVEKKGFDVAVEATRRAAGAFRLVLAGPRELPAGVPDGTEALGQLTPEQLAEIYRAVDAIVVPSRPGEGLPLITQEAMASGLPVVMTDDPGYRDLIADAGPALRLLALDAPAFARALAEAVRLRDERPDAVADMVAFARRSFSWDDVADRHEALYQQLGAS